MCSIVSRLKRWLMTLLGEFGMTAGDFGNVGKARYAVPDMWTMGEVYAILIKNVSGEDDVVESLLAVYTSS